MTSEQMMVLFTLLSFGALGLGAVVLSLVTLLNGGLRVMAIALAGAELVMGFFIYFTLDPLGWTCIALGVLALIIAVIPRRKKTTDE